MKSFDYHEPDTLVQACALLARYQGQARALAGGTDLLIRLKRSQAAPAALVNLKHIPGLNGLAQDDDGALHVGALVTLRLIAKSPLIGERWPVLAQTAAGMASSQVRNIATVGGNLCNAAPSADMAPPLIALDAQARIVGSAGERTLPLEEFFVGPGKTVLAADEVLAEIIVPAQPPGARASYQKLKMRQAMDIAVVGVAVWVSSSKFSSSNFICDDARIVLGAVAPTPLRVREAEDMLRGQALTEALIAQAAQAAAAAARPISDVRGSAWYRREMVAVLTRRQLLGISALSL